MKSRLDAVTGRELWKESYPCATIVRWPGPRATPTVAGGVVYTLGQHGQLRAWDAKTGALRWAVDLAAAYHPDPDYGFPWSPLIEGELLILGGGSRGMALHTKDGTSAWGADERPGAWPTLLPQLRGGSRLPANRCGARPLMAGGAAHGCRWCRSRMVHGSAEKMPPAGAK